MTPPKDVCQSLYLPMGGKRCSAGGFKLYATAMGSTLKKVLKKESQVFNVNKP